MTTEESILWTYKYSGISRLHTEYVTCVPSPCPALWGDSGHHLDDNEDQNLPKLPPPQFLLTKKDSGLKSWGKKKKTLLNTRARTKKGDFEQPEQSIDLNFPPWHFQLIQMWPHSGSHPNPSHDSSATQLNPTNILFNLLYECRRKFSSPSFLGCHQLSHRMLQQTRKKVCLFTGWFVLNFRISLFWAGELWKHVFTNTWSNTYFHIAC